MAVSYAETVLNDGFWMRRAIDLSRRCPPAGSAYSVGAVIVDAGGVEIAYGYSRETDPLIHAEESALAKLGGSVPAGATLYSTLEPCSMRASRPVTCTELTLIAGIRRVVIAWREPSLFVADCQGVELLREAGVEVVELSHLANQARAVNNHLPV